MTKNRDYLIKYYLSNHNKSHTFNYQFRIYLFEFILHIGIYFKRFLDISISISALIVLSPLLLLTAILIIIEDGFPVFYVSTRVGINGKEFSFYKFRSMYRNAEAIKEKLIKQNESKDGVIFKLKKDPRVTRVGGVIRKISVDELPQLFNVLQGHMSLVGPRPPIPNEVKKYTLFERKRLNIKPGITCIWQTSGRSDIPFHKQVELDLEYIQSESIHKYITLLLKTIPAVVSGRGAY